MTNKLPINRFSRLAFWASVLAFIVIIMGAYTRLNNAGLSCPDWPRCYGYLGAPETKAEVLNASKAYPKTPVDTAKAWIEMRHRYLAGLEGLLILALVALSWRWRKQLPALAFGLTQVLIAVMFCQVLLGMLTVTALLKPVIVLSHLLLGFTVMSLLWVVALLTANQRGRKPFATLPPRFQPWIVLGLLILILQIALGGWVSTHYAGLVCTDLPYCNGVLLPNLHWGQLNTDLVSIHMLHRIGAALTFFYLAILSLLLMMRRSARPYGLLLAILLLTQISLGILNILWYRPLHLALTHHAVAALLLLTLLAMLVNIHRQRTKV